MSTHYPLIDNQENPKRRSQLFAPISISDRSAHWQGRAKLGKCKALMERWSSQWRWVARVEAYTDHMFRQADLEQQQARGKIVTRDETLEELSAIVRADPNEVPKLRYGEKLRGIELAGKYHRLFTDQIEVKQSVDVNVTHEVRAAIHAVVQTEHISECDAALRLAECLGDVPELAARLRELAAGSAPLHLGPVEHDADVRRYARRTQRADEGCQRFSLEMVRD